MQLFSEICHVFRIFPVCCLICTLWKNLFCGNRTFSGLSSFTILSRHYPPLASKTRTAHLRILCFYTFSSRRCALRCTFHAHTAIHTPRMHRRNASAAKKISTGHTACSRYAVTITRSAAKEVHASTAVAIPQRNGRRNACSYSERRRCDACSVRSR